jgi:hypothetical protein
MQVHNIDGGLLCFVSVALNLLVDMGDGIFEVL